MKSEISEQFLNNQAFINFVPNEEMSSDLQKKLKKINKLPDGLYETKFKIDRYKFDRALKNELAEVNSLENLFDDIMTETNTTISLRMTCKSNSKLRNPLVSVVGSLEGIELAKERILAIFENIKMRVVLKMDVSYKDHSHIIGRGGFSIQRVMDDTGSHVHFPDSNRISDVKKSNVVLICGSPTGVEQARCKIRNLLPLVVHFKIPVDYLKMEHLKRGTSSKLVESYAKHLRPITQAYNVHISIRNSHDIDEGYAAIFDSSNTCDYIAVSVRGANNDLGKLHDSLQVLVSRLTDFNTTLDIDYVLTIEITEFYHQLVMGTNFFNIKSIMQSTGCIINFPEIETNQRPYDFDNLNEIPVNRSTVIIKGKSFKAIHTAWRELIGYLPLVLTMDVAHDQPLDTALINQLKKQFKVAIFLKHKEKFNTVIIRGMEKNSRALFEVRKQLLKLEDAEIPICCDYHAAVFGQCMDENGNSALTINENSYLGSLMSPTSFHNSTSINSLNLMNGNSAANILNAKMMQIDSNNNLNDKNNFFNQLSSSTEPHMPCNIDNAVFQRMFQERLLQLNQVNQFRSKPSLQQPFNSMYNNSSPLVNANLNDEVHKLFRQQHGLIDSSLRNTHSVSDIASLQTNHSIFHNDGLHHAIKKEHLTSSCSSPSLNAIIQNSSNTSLINHNSSNFSMNTSNLNSTGNNTHSSTATASTANNSFNSNGLNSSPPTNSNSSFGSLMNNQSPMQSAVAKNLNWLDQRRPLLYDECKLLALKKTYEKPDSNEMRIPSSVWSSLGFSKSMSQDTLRSNRLTEWNPLFNSSSNGMNGNNAGGLCLEDIQKHSINKMNLGTTDSNDFPWPDMMHPSGNKQRALIKQESEICSSTHPYSSSYLSNLMNSDRQHQFANFAPGQQYLPNNSSSDHQPAMNRNNQLQTFIDVNKIDLSTVLCEYQLGKYVEVFKQYKIDFAQFLSLTEDDLANFGIQYVGRKKVYTAIIELRTALQSDVVGNNFAKITEKCDDDLSTVMNKEIKSFSPSMDFQADRSPTSTTKDINDNMIKKFNLFDDMSNGFSNDTKTDDQTVSSGSVEDICNLFDPVGIGKAYSMNDQMMSSSANEIKNGKFDIHGDALDADSTKSPNRSLGIPTASEVICSTTSTTQTAISTITKTKETENTKETDSLDSDENANHLSSSQSAELINHGGSLQEILPQQA